MKNRFILQLWLVALFAIAVSAAAHHPALSQSSAQAPEPSIKLQGLDGKTYNLADLHGNVLLVSFGATWCTPCTAELRALEELTVEYRDKPVKFFWVTIESQEQVSNSALKRYAKERKVTFPVLRDSAKLAYTQFSPRVRLPMIVFFGKDGHVDTPVHFGMRSPVDFYKGDMRTRLNKLLSARAESNH